MKNVSDIERVVDHLASIEMVERITARELVLMTNKEAWRRMQLSWTRGPAWRERSDWPEMMLRRPFFAERNE